MTTQKFWSEKKNYNNLAFQWKLKKIPLFFLRLFPLFVTMPFFMLALWDFAHCSLTTLFLVLPMQVPSSPINFYSFHWQTSIMWFVFHIQGLFGTFFCQWIINATVFYVLKVQIVRKCLKQIFVLKMVLSLDISWIWSGSSVANLIEKTTNQGPSDVCRGASSVSSCLNWQMYGNNSTRILIDSMTVNVG